MSMHSLKPGEFSEGEPSYQEQQAHTFEPNMSASLVEAYRLITSQIETPLERVLYPCCQDDVSPSGAFPGAKVTYVDMNKEAMEALRRHGYDAHYGRVPTGRDKGESSSDSSGAPNFMPNGEIDLLVLLNPQISPDGVVNWVRNQGYVLCNNYHSTANEIQALPGLTPVAMVHNGHEQKRLDTTALQEYFRLLQTDSEYLQRDPDAYSQIQRHIYGRLRTAFPKVFDVTKAIPAFLKLVKGAPEYFGTVQVGKHLLPKPLRGKSSRADDLFLFQKTVDVSQ